MLLILFNFNTLNFRTRKKNDESQFKNINTQGGKIYLDKLSGLFQGQILYKFIFGFYILI